MVSQDTDTPRNGVNGRHNVGGSGGGKGRMDKSMVVKKSVEKLGERREPDTLPGLQDYQLGDCVGKGAFGSVYRALNWGTGETVAVKQVRLADLPKSELRVIMLEIDLLKNLNHPNIVKYHGFVKSSESLYIILEYCENGSLHSISKKFGKFPENLVGLYMSQVLHGLLYLHEQGVIHRDIKGANILTTKEGLVKLADFGVATKASGLHESSVVGTPYWMAPEVIELAGATTASDIWSLGCTVIELIDGKPPYHKLPPMAALFRIVNDDHPPFPESISPALNDFLIQCFQKEPQLRISAKKLLRHQWILAAKRTDSVIAVKPDEAVKSVQEWNEALKSPNATVGRTSKHHSASPTPELRPTRPSLEIPRLPTTTRRFQSPDTTEEVEIWDDDFASAISPSVFDQPHLKPVDNYAGMLSSEKLKAFASIDVVPEEDDWDAHFQEKLALNGDTDEIRHDPQKTVRATSPIKKRAMSPITDQTHVPKNSERVSSQPKTQILRPAGKSITSPIRQPSLRRKSSLYQEQQVEDYDDLSPNDNDAFDRKLKELRLKADHEQLVTPNPSRPIEMHESRNSSSRTVKNGHSMRQHSGSNASLRQASMRRTKSNAEIQKYAEKDNDDDFSDIFGKDGSMPADSEAGSDVGVLNMVSSKIWSASDDDEDDPFAGVEESFDEMELEDQVARDKYGRLIMSVESLVASLKTTQPDEVLDEVSAQLLQILSEAPELRNNVMTAHGLLPILELLDSSIRRDVSLRLLRIINIIISDSKDIQEHMCFIGGIPIISRFAQKKFSKEIRVEAAAFVRQMYSASTLTLQMFISCGGLNVLVDFLEEDYDAERDLVLTGVNGLSCVFELQGPTPKNDFCRILSRSTVLYPLSLILTRVLDERDEAARIIEGRITGIFLIFSHAENHVKESIADRMVLKRVLKDMFRMAEEHQITMLKFIKNISALNNTLEPLHQSNCIEVMTELLASDMDHLMKESKYFEEQEEGGIRIPLNRKRDGVGNRELSNQVTNILFNVCRLSKTRQEDAALIGIIPLLQKIARTRLPVKEFVLPVLCDMAHASNVTRKILWQNKGLDFYVSLLLEPFWQVSILDAIFNWLQEETAKVEENLLEGDFANMITQCYVSSGENFDNLLEPLQKLLRLSPPIATTLAHRELFFHTRRRLRTRKALVRGNLLRVIRSICDAPEQKLTLLRDYGLYDTVEQLANHDPAILVRNMASDLIQSSDASTRRGAEGTSTSGRYGMMRRTSSSTMTPPSLYSSYSQPPTPSHVRSSQSIGDYFDITLDATSRARANMSGMSSSNSTLYRPVSRDGPSKTFQDVSGQLSSAAGTPTSNGHTPSSRSRLPRTSAARLSRSSIAYRRDENSIPSAAGAAAPISPNPTGTTGKSGLVLNRRRRQTSGTG